MTKQEDVMSAGWSNYRMHQLPKPKPKPKSDTAAWSKRDGAGGLDQTQCLLAEGYLAPAAGDVVDSSVKTTVSWDTSCFKGSGGTLDLYLYALNKSSLLLPIHGWRSIPANKGSTQLKLAPSWWIDDPHKSQNQSLYLNIVPSGNQPWDTANPTGPTWTATYVAPAKGHSPPKDALSDPSSTNKVISVFYASGGLTGAGKTATIVCPIIVVVVIAALVIRKLHINRNNKTADFAEKVDNRMSRISIDWAAGGDGSEGPLPGSRPASYIPQSRSGYSMDFGLHNRAGVGAASEPGWIDATKRNSQVSFAPGTRVSYDPTVPSPLAGDRPQRASASASAMGTSNLKQAWYPPSAQRGYGQEDEMEDLDDFAVMSAEEKMGARPLPPAEALELDMPSGSGSHPLAQGPGPHDSVITPSEAANPFELDRSTPGHSPMPAQEQFQQYHPDSAYDDGAMVSTGPIGHAYTPSQDQYTAQEYPPQSIEGGLNDPGAEQNKRHTLFATDAMADDPWSADIDAQPSGHHPRASEAWTPADFPTSATNNTGFESFQSAAMPESEQDFSSYQAAAAAGMTEDDAVPAGGHGRSTSVAQRELGGAHVRTASAGPRTLIGAPPESD